MVGYFCFAYALMISFSNGIRENFVEQAYELNDEPMRVMTNTSTQLKKELREEVLQGPFKTLSKKIMRKHQ